MVVAAAFAAIALAACGGGKTTATNASATIGALDPASKVPADALAYAAITIKPQGSLKTDLVSTVDKLAGPGAAQRAATSLTSSFGTRSEVKQAEAWLGPQAGVAVTALPSGTINQKTLEQHLLIVASTNDPAAASKFLQAQPKTSFGIDSNVPGTWKIVGHFVLIGGKPAVDAAASTATGNSLAADATFQSTISQIGSNQLAAVFVRPKPIVQAVLPLLSTEANSAQLTDALKKVPADAAVAVGLTAGPHTVSFDAVTQNFPKSKSTGAPSDVGSLPGDSWLALAIAGSLANPKTISTLQNELPALISQAQSEQVSTASTVQGILPFIQNDVIPALGPISLSAAGTSLGGLHIGFEMTPDDSAAGDKLVTALKGIVQGLPVAVSSVDKKVVVTFGYTDAQDFLSPPTKLSGNPTYKAALAQMPSGSDVPVYLNFGPLAVLGSALDTNPSDASTWKIAARLNYLIAGGTSTHIRVVLAVK
jgi:Protein of unknown function (DUF3352)